MFFGWTWWHSSCVSGLLSGMATTRASRMGDFKMPWIVCHYVVDSALTIASGPLPLNDEGSRPILFRSPFSPPQLQNLNCGRCNLFPLGALASYYNRSRLGTMATRPSGEHFKSQLRSLLLYTFQILLCTYQNSFFWHFIYIYLLCSIYDSATCKGNIGNSYCLWMHRPHGDEWPN